MHVAAPLLCAALAALLGLSGFGKLRSPDRGDGAFTALRLDVARPRVAVTVLSVVELVLAVGLVVGSGTPLTVAAVATAAMMVALSVVVARAARLGSTDECGCFGGGSGIGGRVGPRLVVRNATYALAAGILAVGAGAGADGGIPQAIARAGHGDPEALVVIVVGGVVALGAMLTGSGSAARPPASTTASGDAPPLIDLVVLRPDGSIADLLADHGGRAQLLVFVKPGCRPCLDLIGVLERRIGALDGRVVTTVLATGPAGGTPRSDPMPLGGTRLPVVVDFDDALAGRFGIDRRPSMLLITSHGVPVPPVASGLDASRELLAAIIDAAAGVGDAE